MSASIPGLTVSYSFFDTTRAEAAAEAFHFAAKAMATAEETALDVRASLRATENEFREAEDPVLLAQTLEWVSAWRQVHRLAERRAAEARERHRKAAAEADRLAVHLNPNPEE